MKNFLTIIFIFLTSLLYSQTWCSGSIVSPGIFGNGVDSVQVTVYNSNGVAIGTFKCHKQNNGGNAPIINCNLSGYGPGVTYTLTLCNGSSNNCIDCEYNSQGQLIVTPMPVELIDFDGYNDGVDNVLCWKTASEKDNDYFILHQSENGIDWNYVGVVNGAGTSSDVIKYEYKHSKYRKELNYYKLSQIDFNGNREEFKIISIDNSVKSKEILRVVNSLGQDVSSDYEGLRIILFTDGTSIKKIGK